MTFVEYFPRNFFDIVTFHCLNVAIKYLPVKKIIAIQIYFIGISSFWTDPDTTLDLSMF